MTPNKNAYLARRPEGSFKNSISPSYLIKRNYMRFNPLIIRINSILNAKVTAVTSY
jgi:hypothetical protein